MAEVNEVVNESNVHLQFRSIQTTSEPDLVVMRCAIWYHLHK